MIIKLKNNYENFNINKMKVLQSFTTQNEIDKILILNDGRILTIQYYSDENDEELYKLCVYSLKNGFACDINIDYEEIDELFQMDDGNVVLNTREAIKILKIKNNVIEEIWTFNDDIWEMKQLLKDNIFIAIKKNKEEKNIFYYYLYSYEGGKLKKYKDITNIYEKEGVQEICQIKENEYVFLCYQKGVIYGNNNYLIFYDNQNDKIIKKIKVGDDKCKLDMFLMNENNLIVEGIKGSIIVIDIQNRQIRKEYKYNIYIKYIVGLNEKYFLYYDIKSLYQYECDDLNNIELKEEKNIDIYELGPKITKYLGNKIIICDKKKLIFMVCNIFKL